MDIPVIIINRDRLQCLERLVGQLLVLGYDNLYVLDMDSSYPPLIEYYNNCKDFTLIPWKNTGHKALWNDGILKEYFANDEWVAVTDSDIELNINTPKNFLYDMVYIAKDYRMNKVGLALEYKDITNPYLKKIIEPIESVYWQHKVPNAAKEIYMAPVDTTMCVIRPSLPFTYTALRVAGDYTCKHLDWYSNWHILTEEEQYYMGHADEAIATTKQHYMKWLKEQHA